MSGEGGLTHRQERTEAQAAELRAEAYRLRLRGLTLRQAAAELDVSHQTIANWSRAEADETIAPLAAELRQQQIDRLGEMRQRALEVLERPHLTVSHGKVIREGRPAIEIDEDTGEPTAVIHEGQGEPILDDAPVLQALDRLLRIEERIAKLAGLDAPTKVESDVNATVTQRPAELDDLISKARERQEAAERELVAGG